MDLKDTYREVEARLSKVNFATLWPSFRKLKFVLYDDRHIYFGDEMINRNEDVNDEFIGNGPIFYKGEYIAIWNLSEKEKDYDILTSEIIKIMFYGFQKQNDESRYPNDLKGIIHYKYDIENLTLKMKESQIICDLLNSFDMNHFNELLKIRHYRKQQFTYQYRYESAVEQVEGTALYIELCSLWMINFDKYRQKMGQLMDNILNIDTYLNIRTASITVGALLIKILVDNNIDFNQHFNNDIYFEEVLNYIDTEDVKVIPNSELSIKIRKYNSETNDIINNVVRDPKNLILEKTCKLTSINITGARYYNGYIVNYFYMGYKDENDEHVLYGDFVIKVQPDLTIERIYKLSK